MKVIIILFIIVLLLSCEHSNNSISLGSKDTKDFCRNYSSMPEGKGEIFKIGLDDAIKIAKNDYYKTKSNTNENPQVVFGQVTLFWYVFFVDSGTLYTVDRQRGTIIRKSELNNLIRKIKSNLNSDEVDCRQAKIIGKNLEKNWMISLGYNENEADRKLEDYDIVTIDLPNYWIVLFDFKFYEENDLNNKNDVAKLPNVRSPSYLINKEFGESFLLWR